MILAKQQHAIAIFELAIQAMADAEDGAIDHDLDMLPQLTRRCIPECVLELRKALAQTTNTVRTVSPGSRARSKPIRSLPLPPTYRVTQATVSICT